VRHLRRQIGEVRRHRRGEPRVPVCTDAVPRKYDQAVKHIVAAVIACLLTAACGDGSLGLAEYNEQGTAIAEVMEGRIAALDAAWDSETATVDDVRMYWDQRIDAYETGLGGFRDLTPSGEVAELHRTGMELFTKLVEAESAVADRVASFESVTGPEEWWATSEGAAVRAAEEDIYSLCLVFQATYDATVARIVVSDVPWIPSEMKEIVQVDIGCETVRRDH
jgi:hypothetical protein